MKLKTAIEATVASELKIVIKPNIKTAVDVKAVLEVRVKVTAKLEASS